jgi:hypothetical protein
MNKKSLVFSLYLRDDFHRLIFHFQLKSRKYVGTKSLFILSFDSSEKSHIRAFDLFYYIWHRNSIFTLHNTMHRGFHWKLEKVKLYYFYKIWVINLISSQCACRRRNNSVYFSTSICILIWFKVAFLCQEDLNRGEIWSVYKNYKNFSRFEQTWAIKYLMIQLSNLCTIALLTIRALSSWKFEK